MLVDASRVPAYLEKHYEAHKGYVDVEYGIAPWLTNLRVCQLLHRGTTVADAVETSIVRILAICVFNEKKGDECMQDFFKDCARLYKLFKEGDINVELSK